MNFGDRVKFRRESLGMTQEELASKLGYSGKWTISKIEKGSSDIPRQKVVEFAKALKTTPVFLMGFTEDALDYSSFSDTPVEKHKDPLPECSTCDKPGFAEEIIETFIDPQDIKADFAMRCGGDSMINMGIEDGDIAFIRKQETLNNGDVGVIIIDDEVTLKRFFCYSDHIELHPANQQYKTLIILKNEHKDVRIIGKLVGFYHQVEKVSANAPLK